MTIEINAPVTKEKMQEAIAKLTDRLPKRNLKQHFGQLKRGIDGLDYQKKARQ